MELTIISLTNVTLLILFLMCVIVIWFLLEDIRHNRMMNRLDRRIKEFDKEKE